MANVISLAFGPGMTLELRTEDPVPSSGYPYLAAMAQAGEELAALLPGSDRA
jgi:hypothetical protein